MSRKSLVVLFSALVLALALLLVVVPRLPQEAPWFLAVLSYFPPALLILVALLMWLQATRVQSRPGQILSSAALLASLSVLGWGFHWPGEGQFRLVSLNAGSWSSDLDRVAEALVSLDPDIVTLQEVWGPEHARWIARHFPGWSWARPEAAMDLLVLSRWPLRDVARAEAEYFRLLTATVHLPDHALTVAAVHLPNPFRSGQVPSPREAWRLHNQQLDELERQLGRVRGPLVVAGDFNAPDLSPRLNPPPGGLVDTFRASGLGCGNTFPAWLPMWRIDYVLAAPGLSATSVRTLTIESCDHRALVVDFKYPPRQVPGREVQN